MSISLGLASSRQIFPKEELSVGLLITKNVTFIMDEDLDSLEYRAFWPNAHLLVIPNAQISIIYYIIIIIIINTVLYR